MKKILLIVSVVIVILLLFIYLIGPARAQDNEQAGSVRPSSEATSADCSEMHGASYQAQSQSCEKNQGEMMDDETMPGGAHGPGMMGGDVSF